MKKSASSTSLRFWRSVALLSLLVIAGLVLGIWKQLNKRTDPVPEAVQTSATALEPELNPGPPLGAYAAFGTYVAESYRVKDLGWSEGQFTEFLEGVRASYEGRGVAQDDEAKRFRDEMKKKVQPAASDESHAAVEHNFNRLLDKEGTLQTESGLRFRVLEEGAGSRVRSTDVVVLSYSVRQVDGVERAELGRTRVEVAVRDLMPGLAEGVQLMHVGGRALMSIPADLSFSEANWPEQVPRGMPLAFLVEVHEVMP